MADLMVHWPDNNMVNIVCHGHSVPAGYFATPRVDTFNAYPHLLHRALNDRFPYAVVNVVVTGIGGENSAPGAERFERDVLCHRPRVVTIDYAIGDRSIGLKSAESSWRSMIEESLGEGAKLLLCTPTADVSGVMDPDNEEWLSLHRHSEQIRGLADEYEVGLVDSLSAFRNYQGHITDLLSWINHPNRKGHELVAAELLRWFPIMKL